MNITALETVLPADKDPTQITARPGASWIPQQVNEEFLQALTGNEAATATEEGGTWTVKVGSGGRRNPAREGGPGMRPPDDDPPGRPLKARYGTMRRSAYDLFEALLRQTRPVVHDVHVVDGHEISVVNEADSGGLRGTRKDPRGGPSPVPEGMSRCRFRAQVA